MSFSEKTRRIAISEDIPYADIFSGKDISLPGSTVRYIEEPLIPRIEDARGSKRWQYLVI